jgi:hypothetical protein
MLFQMIAYWNLSVVGMWTLVLQRVLKAAFYSLINGSGTYAAEMLPIRSYSPETCRQTSFIPEQKIVEQKIPGIYDSEPDILPNDRLW